MLFCKKLSWVFSVDMIIGEICEEWLVINCFIWVNFVLIMFLGICRFIKIIKLEKLFVFLWEWILFVVVSWVIFLNLLLVCEWKICSVGLKCNVLVYIFIIVMFLKVKLVFGFGEIEIIIGKLFVVVISDDGRWLIMDKLVGNRSFVLMLMLLVFRFMVLLNLILILILIVLVSVMVVLILLLLNDNCCGSIICVKLSGVNSINVVIKFFIVWGRVEYFIIFIFFDCLKIY